MMGLLNALAGGIESAAETVKTVSMEQIKADIEEQKQQRLAENTAMLARKNAEYDVNTLDPKRNANKLQLHKDQATFDTSDEQIAQAGKKEGILSGARAQAETDVKVKNAGALANAAILSNALQATPGNLKNISAMANAAEGSAAKAQAAATLFGLSQAKELVGFQDALTKAITSGDQAAINKAASIYEVKAGKYIEGRRADQAGNIAGLTAASTLMKSAEIALGTDPNNEQAKEQLKTAKLSYDWYNSNLQATAGGAKPPPVVPGKTGYDNATKDVYKDGKIIGKADDVNAANVMIKAPPTAGSDPNAKPGGPKPPVPAVKVDDPNANLAGALGPVDAGEYRQIKSQMDSGNVVSARDRKRFIELTNKALESRSKAEQYARDNS